MNDDRGERIHHLRSLTDVAPSPWSELGEPDRARHLRVADARIDRPSGPTGDARGETTAAINRAVVEVLRAHTGTWPTQVKTEMTSGLAIVTLGDRLPAAQTTPGGEDQSADELQLRTAVYQGMRAEAVAAVEAITGRPVVAYFTDHQAGPDLAVIVFVFGPSARGRS
jgi:uncharacterized protein YbcI